CNAPHNKPIVLSSLDTQDNQAKPDHTIPSVVAIAVVPPLPPPALIRRPAGKTVALPLRLQFEKVLPGLPCLPVQIPPETLFQLTQKMLEMLVDRNYLRHRV